MAFEAWRFEQEESSLTQLFFRRGRIFDTFAAMRLPSSGPSRKMSLIPLIAATFFMVSGGPYGIEDILGGAGYGKAVLLLLVLPIVWSLPVALMVGELAGALPAEGGFYVWVRRALGPFWGYQEAWLSLVASIFDMAVYPVLFVSYIGRLAPTLTSGHRSYLLALFVVLLCLLWNLRGAPAVGEGAVWLSILLLSPFAVLIILGFWKGFYGHPVGVWRTAPEGAALSTAVLVALWNYMGWDNASTVAGEVEDPQRNYLRAMLGSIALVAASYLLPLAAVAFAGISVESFSTGSWTDAARQLGGPLLATGVVLGGMINGLGMFNALMLSYTRLPLAMAEDGMLPASLAWKNEKGVPWLSLLVCGIAWAGALNFSFERLISIDLILYGSSLLLEFVALIALRLKEPHLPRPFRAGNLFGACALAVGPLFCIGYALYAARGEHFVHMPAPVFALLAAGLGPVGYGISVWSKGRQILAPSANATDVE